jgi:hypothetical protein
MGALPDRLGIAAALAAVLSAMALVGVSAPAGQTGLRRPGVGRSITLRGDDEVLRITLLKVYDPAHVQGSFGAARPGNKLVAALLKLTNLDRAFYRDSPGNGAKLISTHGRIYPAVLPGVAPNLDGLAGMASDKSQVGWLTFEVPIHMRPWKLRFVLDSGFAEQTGEWLLR